MKSLRIFGLCLLVSIFAASGAFAADPSPEVEPNDSSTQAQELASETAVMGEIASGTDQDWYLIDTTGTFIFGMVQKLTDTSQNVVFSIRDTSGTFVWSKNSYETGYDPYNFTLALPSAGQYYFVVEGSPLQYQAEFVFSSTKPKYSNSYYLPYFINDSDHSTGVAVHNLSSVPADIKTTVYGQDGTAADVQTASYSAKQQNAFYIGDTLNQEGWILVQSSQSLAGLCFINNTSGGMNYMADISLLSSTHKNLCVPHTAQDSNWDTSVLICNPNDSENVVTLEFYDPNNNKLYSAQHTLAAYGSGKFPLTDLVQGTIQPRGRVDITAEKGVAAFALYNNLKTGGYSYAGISAVPQ